MTDQSHFVFELGCEELPSSTLLQLTENLHTSIKEQLELAGINYKAIEMISAPRRVGFQIFGLAQTSMEQVVQKRGPSVNVAYTDGQPAIALLGFCKGLGISTDQVSILEEENGAWVMYSGVQKGIPTIELIGQLCVKATRSLTHPKSMRWGSNRDDFPRPVRWVLAMFGATVIDLTLFSKQSSNRTYGHRFHAPSQIKLKQASEYSIKLEKNFVIANFKTRKVAVWEQIQSVAESNGVAVEKDDRLLDEISALVEWPIGLAGKFESKFLPIPDIILIAAMRRHQKVFHTRKSSGKLSNIFITVSNIQSKKPKEVIKGNQRVIRARLSDAKFFFDADRKSELKSRRSQLDSILYHPKLGTLGDKTSRVSKLALAFCTKLDLDKNLVARATDLSRCDLTTEMVMEFDELQGQIGRIYAELEGLDPTITKAIGGLYRPAGIEDSVPDDLLGSLIGLCDRIDTVCGLFAIGQPPTGSKDPFGLRRAAIGILRLNEHNGLKLDLLPIIKQGVKVQPVSRQDTFAMVVQFIKDRERVRLTDLGLSHDVVIAAQGTEGLWSYQNTLRAHALQDYRKYAAFNDLVAANKRVANILEKNSFSQEHQINEILFANESEFTLWAAVRKLEPQINDCVSRETYNDALGLLAGIHPEINQFFQNVMVNDPMPSTKINRLALLQKIRELFLIVADLSLIQS